MTGAVQSLGVDYLVKNQYSGFHEGWVRASNDSGLPEMAFCQTRIAPVPNALSGFGWNRPGCCVVRYDASAVTALAFGLLIEAMMRLSAFGSV